MRSLSDRTAAGLLEAAPDAMICVTADGRIAVVNAAAERLFGYPREELIGQPVEILLPDVAAAAHPGHRAGYLADPRPRPMGEGTEVAGRRRDGSTFCAEVSLSAVRTGEGLLLTAAVRDVTERLRALAERERLRSQAARSESEAREQQARRLENLGQLAGGVAHDFNNLLGVILNYASFVGEELAAMTESDWAKRGETAREDVGQVIDAADRAASLTRQLLAFSRREVTRPVVLGLNDVVSGVAEMLRRTLGDHIELITSLAGDLWPVLADPAPMEQLLINLAVNARDAMPGGGTLTIETGNIIVDDTAVAGGSQSRLGRNVRLRVSDTGIGMTPDVIEHAFEPFFTTKGAGSGAGPGLGLATVFGILAQADGNIGVYSEPGAGTTFSITLPVTTQAPVEVAEPAAYRRTARGETILVVEDQDALLQVTKRILIRNGYRVLAAANGRQAFDAARDHLGEIHLLLTDVVMPQMLGKEVAEKMRAIRPGIGVLYMSGYARPVLASQGRLDPKVALVEKPFSEADLLTKIGQVLDGQFGGFQSIGDPD